MADEKRPHIVLVHGAFVDGSGWQGVYKILTRDGYTVSVVQHATASLRDDVATTKLALAQQDRPAILVGHSYGGVVITEAGNDPKVVGLVYIDGFAPVAGESVAALIKDPVPGAAMAPILPPQQGKVFVDKARFHAAFAADLDADTAAFMADSQPGWGVEAIEAKIDKPAFASKPSWYLVGTEDNMIPPVAQRAMAKRAGATIVEAKGSHAIFASQPKAVAALIADAAGRLQRKAA